MSDQRRLAVLRAIVHDYVATSEPVGSKALIERHQLGVSAATVRGDMAVLEDEGLITAPHTSAGRIPTDAGYRAFVDSITSIRPMSRAEKAAIVEFLEGAVDLDDVIARTGRLLAHLTRQVAVVRYPSLTASTVRHIELVDMGRDPSDRWRVMMVLVASSGRVEQRIITVDAAPSSDPDRDLRTCRALILAEVVGARLADAVVALGRIKAAGQSQSLLLTAVIDILQEAADEEHEARISMVGTSHLAAQPHDFPLSLEPVLDALEQHVVLLRFLGSVTNDPDHRSRVEVRIGSENPIIGLQSTSMVSTTYGSGTDLVGSLGVFGPTRMDYPHAMAQVRAVAAYLTGILTS